VSPGHVPEVRDGSKTERLERQQSVGRRLYRIDVERLEILEEGLGVPLALDDDDAVVLL